MRKDLTGAVKSYSSVETRPPRSARALILRRLGLHGACSNYSGATGEVRAWNSHRTGDAGPEPLKPTALTVQLSLSLSCAPDEESIQPWADSSSFFSIRITSVSTVM